MVGKSPGRTLMTAVLLLCLTTCPGLDGAQHSVGSYPAHENSVEDDPSEAWLIPQYNTTTPATMSPDDGSDSGNAITHCTKSTACRLSVLAGVVFCVAVGVCLIIRENKFKGQSRGGGAVGPEFLNTQDAHAVMNYAAHEELWPGPQEWKKMSVQQRGKVTAKVVKVTTQLLRGQDSARNSATLNEWVRGEEGIFVRDIELVKDSLDDLVCMLEPAQAAPHPDLGEPWPQQPRWRRLSQRAKSTIYASCIKGNLNTRNDLRKFAKWVRERGFLLNQVDLAHQEARCTVRNILGKVPVAFSDNLSDLGMRGARNARLMDSEASFCLDDDRSRTGSDTWDGRSTPEGRERAPLVGKATRAQQRQQNYHTNNGGGIIIGNKLVPELSVTVASMVSGQEGYAKLSKEDSLAVFSQYLDTSPRLLPSEAGDVTPQATLSPASNPSLTPTRNGWASMPPPHPGLKQSMSAESSFDDSDDDHLPGLNGLNDDVP